MVSVVLIRGVGVDMLVCAIATIFVYIGSVIVFEGESSDAINFATLQTPITV